MGNPAQIEVKSEEGSVFLYTHYRGVDGCREAIYEATDVGEDRLNDPPYFTRILFCSLILSGGGDFTGTLGYGISPKSLGEVGCVVDLVEQTIDGEPVHKWRQRQALNEMTRISEELGLYE